MRLGELLPQPLNRRVTKVIVVVVRNHHGVNNGQVFNLAWRRRVALQTLDSDGCAAVLEDGVEEHAEARGELDVVTCVAQPRRAEFGRRARGEEGGCADGDCWGACIGGFCLAGDFAPRGRGKFLSCEDGRKSNVDLVCICRLHRS